MSKINELTYLVSQRNQATFEQKKNRLILRVLIISSLIIFVIETLVMFGLELYLKALPAPIASLVDGFTLILILFPINYFFIVRPMMVQIDQHHRTNQELLKTNEVLERFFSISDILIAYLDADFNFLRVNLAYSKTDERPPEAFIGKNHFDLFPNDENFEIFTSVVQTGKPYYAVEKPFSYAEHPERGVTYWDWSLLPVKDSEDAVIALILVLNNVTDRKLAQLALEESERRFRVVFNQALPHIALINTVGQVQLVNQTALKFSGLSQADVQDRPFWKLPWWSIGPTSTLQETSEKIQAAVLQASSGSVFRSEQRVRSSTGDTAMMDMSIKPVLDEQGKTLLLVYEARDITERIQAENALVASERRLKRMYQAETRAREFAETLRSAVLAFSESLHSETVLETLLDHLHKVVPYSSAHLLLLEDADNLVVRMERCVEKWEVELSMIGERFEVSDLSFFQPLLVDRTPLVVSDTLLSPGTDILPDDWPVISMLGMPLLAGDQVIGICLLEHKCPDFFSDDLIHWATALIGQAAVAIQNAWLFEQVRDGREHLLALSRRLVEVQENERHYIARELHDEAGQALASLMIGLRSLERESDHPEAVVSRSKELNQIADGVLENLHRLAIDLRPAALDHLGLVAALRQHAERFSDETGLAVQFETLGTIERLSGEIETTVYRIVQEALTNVERHAHATRVDILIERRGLYLVVVVEDNGVGFEPQSHHSGRLGLLGMHERAEMLGGKLTFESAPGKGATMLLEVPCQFES